MTSPFLVRLTAILLIAVFAQTSVRSQNFEGIDEASEDNREMSVLRKIFSSLFTQIHNKEMFANYEPEDYSSEDGKETRAVRKIQRYCETEPEEEKLPKGNFPQILKHVYCVVPERQNDVKYRVCFQEPRMSCKNATQQTYIFSQDKQLQCQEPRYKDVYVGCHCTFDTKYFPVDIFNPSRTIIRLA